MNTHDNIPGRFGLEAGYVSMDGQYVWFGTSPYERNLQAQIDYVEVLCRVVPQVRESLLAKTLNVDFGSIGEYIEAWKKQYHLDDWVSDKIIEYCSNDWPNVYKWFLETHRFTEPSFSPFDFYKPFIFRVNFFPYLDRLDELKQLANKAFEEGWVEFARSMQAEADQGGWKRKGDRSRSHKVNTIERHLEWLARYQSGGESPACIADGVKSKYGTGEKAKKSKVEEKPTRAEGGTVTDPNTVRLANKKMAEDLDITLRKES